MLTITKNSTTTSSATSTLLRWKLKWFMALITALLISGIFLAAFGVVFAPYDYADADLLSRLRPPIFFGGDVRHLLGTDELGRDVLSRLLSGMRLSILVALGASSLSATIGVSLGFLAAHFRGVIEAIILMLIDLQAALPFFLMALAVVVVFGNGIVVLTVVMGLYGWERTARVARGLALSSSQQGYAQAIELLGAHPLQIYFRHILPSISGTLIVGITFSFPDIILLETTLSFLGLGVQPPHASLGNMVGFGQPYLQIAPWIVLAPSIVIVTVALLSSIVGDRLRDRLM
ncbi:ABC transporter permease [Bradyrhizobium valentinum]|uniref:ABC transporter permease n=1 Tax=Bradyrhizobium valentinum TaxID=1518501 RepID=UPI00070D6996|nr:ABC transporter permease [Bradyrhizobium valentinum]KRQ95444.1 peptide ABC transporter permease [Bradyrhizobium valentinum]